MEGKLVSKTERTFDQSLTELEEVVSKLEQGDVPLEEALDQFQEGIKLSRYLKKTLQEAEATMTKIVDENGNETPVEPETDSSEN